MLALSFVSACTKKPQEVANQSNATNQMSNATDGGDMTDPNAPILDEGKSALVGSTGLEEQGPLYRVHFDYDQYTIGGDASQILEKNAGYLKGHPSTFIRIEGHCDDRGSVEYNLALGERRANSAKEWLVHAGIQAKLMDTISYGEDRPLIQEASEYAWAQNRRAEFRILSE